MTFIDITDGDCRCCRSAFSGTIGTSIETRACIGRNQSKFVLGGGYSAANGLKRIDKPPLESRFMTFLNWQRPTQTL